MKFHDSCIIFDVGERLEPNLVTVRVQKEIPNNNKYKAKKHG